MEMLHKPEQQQW